MNSFHNTVSRRDFMKGLGLAGAGLGAAAATTPVFHDLDEVIGDPAGTFKQPWWIKRREFNNPTIEIDINMYKRYDRRHMYDDPYNQQDRDTVAQRMDAWGYSKFPTQGKTMTELKAMWPEFENEHVRQGVKGMALRDVALNQAVGLGSNGAYTPNFLGTNSFITDVISPQTRGVPKWTGTPEENLRMLRVVGRYACYTHSLAAVEMNDFNRHFEWATDGQSTDPKASNYGKDIVFADVDKASETATQYVIPNNCRYTIPMMDRHGAQAMKTAPGAVGQSSPWFAYFFGYAQYAHMVKFLRGIGYQGYYNLWSGAAAFPVLSGLGEKGRPGLILVPYHGPLVRKTDSVLTDLPLAPEPPIDGGMNRFCYTCKKCADACPTESISLDTEPSWDVTGPWNAAGIKNWGFKYPTCGSFKSSAVSPGYCGLCLARCPFGRTGGGIANIHKAIQATVSNTSVFDHFFTKMDYLMGYGKNLGAEKGHTEDNYVEEWWNTLGPEAGVLTYEGNIPPSY